jgi:hypothetical protein
LSAFCHRGQRKTAAGVTVYAVQVNTGGDPTSTLLQNCASDSSKFFLLISADAIVTTFDQIGTALSKLYMAKIIVLRELSAESPPRIR